MTITTLERFPEEGPDFRGSDTGALHFEPYGKPRPESTLGKAATEGAVRVEDIALPEWWHDIVQSDDGQRDPLLTWEADIAHPDHREPWEKKGGIFRMRYDTPPEENPGS